MVSNSTTKEKAGPSRRIGGGVFKRTIQQKITRTGARNGLTNRPEFHSKSLNIQRPKQNQHERNVPQNGARLVIKNLDFHIKQEDLEELFSSFGKITKCAILRHRDGKSLGMCHIDFNEEKDGLQAMEDYNGLPLDGREMSITCIKGAEVHERMKQESAEIEEMRQSFDNMSSNRRRSKSPKSRRNLSPRRRRSRSPPRYEDYNRNRPSRKRSPRPSRQRNRHSRSVSKSSHDSDDKAYRRRRRSSDRRR